MIADSETREAATTFGLSAFPFTVFVNADGLVEARVTGGIPYDAIRDAVDFLAGDA